eukprot:CAMPEP_0201285734 /NCGR_PEP_ID=MMETSP1317-20130820/113747_1 /ASSEMBLY_ACC=CAM_ASM_000770 /TAXON_ID=187299 /ORGANISM="Undescribed Undescribed, Strain Undescribed" /LENGTH=33 /DNA_ID= /DNA_START= /DNA_END= /DNA_ORIENTATION=
MESAHLSKVMLEHAAKKQEFGSGGPPVPPVNRP